MRSDDIIVALQNKRRDLQNEIFASPPTNYEDFVKRLGVWIGVGESLRIIEDARKKEYDE